MPKPKPKLVRDLADLSGAMRDAYRRSGYPPVRKMERQAGPGRLSRTMAHSVITARTVPREVRTYIAFLETCEITGRDLIPWFVAWAKVRHVSTEQEVFRLHAPLPSEQLYIVWFEETQKAPPAHLHIIDGQHRTSTLTKLTQVRGGDTAAIAA